MSAAELRKQYTATIGIECHVQFKTASKLFSAAGNDAREAPPNTLVNHIDFGLPGALPVLNAEAVHLAMRAAFALDSTPQKFSKFDRKHYFYPDLPMGYQITQYDQPIVLGGSIDIDVDGEKKTIGITRAHMEADAGKSTHPGGADYSLVDLNRAGTPLLEIVSEPDMHTAAEAKAYARELYLRMKYADVSDCNLYYGNMRFDVNVSVSKSDELGTRTETKNLNSFRSVERTVEYEIDRQIAELEKGGTIVQETRGWDDAKQKTFSQRTKENADDYRYFPDPDLPPIVLTDEYIEKVKTEMPVMPDEWRSRLGSLGLDKSQIETLLDAQVEFTDEGYLPLLEASMHDASFAKQLANWLVNVDIPYVRDSGKPVAVERAVFYKAIADLIAGGKLSSTNAKALIIELLSVDALPESVEKFAEEKGYVQVSNEDEIAKIVEQVLGENAKAAEDVKNGEMKAIGFLVGQVMKNSKGKANPQMAQELIKKQLGI
ncbi:MAG TPA: Asp-tRNA(Asn)/Glu-tRNA(Gln) amidotransferase subunit GatB [Candidatus Saccharimonadales bacterium]|nr:Asp-tRNA(Asn)/Glu-tRNA(Gln) amidotransferase subunit GatB [Candidatus Saccharimonadales bacterium]